MLWKDRLNRYLMSDEELNKVTGGFGIIPNSEPNPISIEEGNGPAEVNVGLNDM